MVALTALCHDDRLRSKSYGKFATAPHTRLQVAQQGFRGSLCASSLLRGASYAAIFCPTALPIAIGSNLRISAAIESRLLAEGRSQMSCHTMAYRRPDGG